MIEKSQLSPVCFSKRGEPRQRTTTTTKNSVIAPITEHRAARKEKKKEKHEMVTNCAKK